jgi:Lon protease-like protein
MVHTYHNHTDLPGTLPLFPLAGVLLLPRGTLPLNVFEPRYLEMVDRALATDRLIGVIQPAESEEEVLRPRLTRVGCAGRIVSFRETDDNRYLITLTGVCRFRLTGEPDSGGAWRAGSCDFEPFAADLVPAESDDFPRDRLLKALNAYLSGRDMKADWNSVITAPGEALINALAMMCPFDPAGKQALLEAPTLAERISTLVALLEISGSDSGPVTLN